MIQFLNYLSICPKLCMRNSPSRLRASGMKKIVNASVVVVVFLLLSTVYVATVCN